MRRWTVSGHTDSVIIHLVNVDLIEAVVAQQIVQVIKGFFALDNGRVGINVRAPRAVDPLLFDDVNFVRNLEQTNR